MTYESNRHDSLSINMVKNPSQTEFYTSFETHPPSYSEAGQPGLNTPEELGRGNIKTEKNPSKHFTILLVGETGTGKTSLLSYLANIVLGHGPQQFTNHHDSGIEAGGGSKHSQTNRANVYEFTSRNGVKVTILDTPGLADTRGFEQDKQHKASIATTIKNKIATVHAVIILANGTQPRLGVATDYVLSTLSSIFPRSLADNIGIVFTNVSSPDHWNFDQNSLPDVLRARYENQWLLDNPLSLWKKNQEMQSQPQTRVTKRFRDNPMDMLRKRHQAALEEMCSLFDWLDDRDPQPTNDIWNLYVQSQQIDNDIDLAMTRLVQISEKKKLVDEYKQLANGNELTMKQYENFKSVITKQFWDRERTSQHNTLCSHPNCYSNCHVDCHLKFSVDHEKFLKCKAIRGGQNCRQCGHKYTFHRHYNEVWKQKDHNQVKIDHTAERKYNEAMGEKRSRESKIIDFSGMIRDLNSDLQKALASVSKLTEAYARLSLSGSFTGQVKKSVKLLEAKLEAVRNNKADAQTIKMIEDGLETMKKKLEVMERANAK